MTVIKSEKTAIDIFIDSEVIKSELQKFNNNFSEVFKQLEQLKHDVELVYKDRDLQKDIFEAMGGLKNIMLEHDKHNETLTQDVKADVLETKQKVSSTSEAIKDTVEFHTDNLADTIENKRVITLKKNKGFFSFIKNIRG